MLTYLNLLYKRSVPKIKFKLNHRTNFYPQLLNKNDRHGRIESRQSDAAHAQKRPNFRHRHLEWPRTDRDPV